VSKPINNSIIAIIFRHWRLQTFKCLVMAAAQV
jgi:hypothetical protein